jgi:hypothetical protein
MNRRNQENFGLFNGVKGDSIKKENRYGLFTDPYIQKMKEQISKKTENARGNEPEYTNEESEFIQAEKDFYGTTDQQH